MGVSFVSTEQACANAEEEVGEKSFEDVWAEARGLWNEKLSRIEIDVGGTPANITEMLYSALYRSNLTPVSGDVWVGDCMLKRFQNNATGETQGKYVGTTSQYFDSFYARYE